MADSVNLTASLLDRLLDDDPSQTRESEQQRIVSEQTIINSVIRDIENLLNTRCSPIDIPKSFTSLSASLIGYGIRDFSVENPETSIVRQKLCKEIESAIQRYEPRLKKAAVRLDRRGKKKGRLYFIITGMLVVDPLNEPVSFDTFFDVGRNRYIISN
jgi:type VI secretion system protein ImpF